MRPCPLLLLTLGGASCASPAPPLPPAPVVEMPPIVAEPPDPTQPLTLPRSASIPRWHEDPIADARSPLQDPRIVEVGQKAALVRTRSGEIFVVHEERGVMGPIVLPGEAQWIGTDDQDRVYAATLAGELFVAAGPDDAVQGRLVRTGEVKGATDWDFTAGMVVAALDDKVFVSRDRGASFTASSPRRGKRVRAVFARFDGAIAARLGSDDDRETHLSRDRGRSWQRSAFSPGSLRRDGAWMWSGSWDCPAVVSADGRGFTVDRARHEGFSALPTWTALLHATARPEGAPPVDRLRVTSPLPPPSTTGKGQQDPARCQAEARMSVLGALRGGVLGGVLGTLGGSPCRGAACLAGTVDSVPEATRTGIGLFRDGVCKDAAPGGKVCAPGSPFTRLPHVARIDHVSGQVRVEALPPGCDPAQIDSIGGLGLLLCKGAGDASLVFTREGSGAWSAEGTIPVRSSEIWATTASPDGGLMLHASCPRGAPCRAVIRAPKPPGDASAWRGVAVPGAVAYRIVDDGAALAVVAGSADHRFSLVLAAPGAAPRPLTGEIDAGDRDLHDLRVDAAGHVIVSGGVRGGRPGSWWVATGGTLEPAPTHTAEAPATKRPVPVRPRPMDPARVR